MDADRPFSPAVFLWFWEVCSLHSLLVSRVCPQTPDSESHNVTDHVITVYCGGRFVLGFGNSFAQLASPMLLTEICHPQHRGPVTAVYNCLWNLGNLGKFSLTRDIGAYIRTQTLTMLLFSVCTFIGWGTVSVANEWSWRSITLIQVCHSSERREWAVPRLTNTRTLA